MRIELILLLIAAYLRKLITPGETNAATAAGITADLKLFKSYLDALDKKDIEP